METQNLDATNVTIVIATATDRSVKPEDAISINSGLVPVCYNKERIRALWRRYAARTVLVVVVTAGAVLTLADICTRLSSVSQRMLERAAINGHGPFFVLLTQTGADAI